MTAVHMVLAGAQLLATATTDSSSSNLHAPQVTLPPRLQQLLRRNTQQGGGDVCGYAFDSFCMLSLMQNLRASR